MIVVYILVLLISFYLMARVCEDYFIDSLDSIAKRFNMSNDAAGATLMAMGSSAPELFIAIIALVRPGDHESIGMGTIVGSAIFNVLIIIGAAVIVRRSFLAWQPVVRDVIFYSASIILLIVAFYPQGGNEKGEITLLEASFFVVLYIVYVLAVVKWRKILPYKDDIAEPEGEEDVEIDKWWEKPMKPFDWTLSKLFPPQKYYYGVFVISILIIAALSWVLVESAIKISAILEIPEAIVALTVLAVGTSVPDLISSVIVAKEGRGGMAISNAFGSNVFDILVGLGLPWLITIAVTGATITVSADNLFSSSIILFATVVIVFGLMLIRRWTIGFKAGVFFIGLYVLYVIFEIVRM